MTTKKNYSLDSELVDELIKISNKIGVAQSQILNVSLKKGLEEIRKLNYNYSEFLKKVNGGK